ncbi:MAG TPA: BON domain-containing protein, partial [Paraburkholderia sp.]
VTLTGSVPDQGQIDMAGDSAKGVAGVTSVSNKLNVQQQ